MSLNQSRVHFLLEDGASPNGEQLSTYIKRKRKPLPFSQEKSKIPRSVFEARFEIEKQEHPFEAVYCGQLNPYTGIAVNSEEDYYEYLREHTYHLLCEEATVRTVKKFQAEQNNEISSIRSKNDALKSDLTKKEGSCRRLRIISIVLLILLLASVVTAFSRRSSRTYEDGYDAGRSLQESAESRKYDEGYKAGKKDGYASGKADGYDAGQKAGYNDGKSDGYYAGKTDGYESGQQTGYNSGKQDGYSSGYSDGYEEGKDDGYNDGYVDGYSDAGKRSSGSGSSSDSGSSSHSGTGSSRDTPIANTFIGNKNSKKFHRSTCSYLPDQVNQVTFSSREDALTAGYTPCGHCNP